MSTYLQKLEKLTYSIHHSPNCSSPFQVRLTGKLRGTLDNLQNKKTQDFVGHGKTLEAAAKAVWQKKYGS